MIRSVKRCTVYDGCEKCRLYNRESYQLHKEQYRATTVAATKRLRAGKHSFVREVVGAECVDCGEDRQETIQYHHAQEPSTLPRRQGSGRMSLFDLPWSALKDEVMKLVALCGNCHLVRHSEKAPV